MFDPLLAGEISPLANCWTSTARSTAASTSSTLAMGARKRQKRQRESTIRYRCACSTSSVQARRLFVELNVNGVRRQVADRHAQTPLLWVLRDVVGERGTKFGCGAGFCAACTVLIDGRNQKSCQVAAAQAVGKAIVTVEGASGRIVDAVRDAWHRGNVVQCGYCQPGQTLAAVSLLESNPAPEDEAIDSWMSGNLCRCGTYPRIRAAIHEAAGTLAAARDPGPLVAPPDPDMQR